MSVSKTFFYSILAGFGLMVAFIAADRPAPPARWPAPSALGLSLRDGISLSEQIVLADVARIKAGGYRTLIDLRPDGEAADQPSSAQIGSAAIAAGLAFAYLPAPHGDIPPAVPEALAKALETAQRPVLLYCRSGKRAARVWALAEATRAGGANAEEIAAAVTGVRQSVDDILMQIKDRIAARQPQATQASNVR